MHRWVGGWSVGSAVAARPCALPRAAWSWVGLCPGPWIAAHITHVMRMQILVPRWQHPRLKPQSWGLEIPELHSLLFPCHETNWNTYFAAIQLGFGFFLFHSFGLGFCGLVGWFVHGDGGGCLVGLGYGVLLLFRVFFFHLLSEIWHRTVVEPQHVLLIHRHTTVKWT